MFPVIQLLGSLEAVVRQCKKGTATEFPVIQLLGSLEASHNKGLEENWFPVIQLLGSLEEHRSETRTLTGV